MMEHLGDDQILDGYSAPEHTPYEAVIVIPAYQPNETLLAVVDPLLAEVQHNRERLILVVNDGSSPEANEIFGLLARRPHVIVLTHSTNRGKGAALKTAFKYVLVHHPEARCIVTADADGQHEPDDILRVLHETLAKDRPVLGVRGFVGDIPFRSRFGNSLTRWLFRMLFRIDVGDTQTGLRGIPLSHAKPLLSIKADRYSFEFEALIYFVKTTYPATIPIKTVYEPGNPTSHFNPLLDSARIYAVFARHVAAVSLIAAVDYLVFLAALQSGSLLWALLIARAISLVLYFTIARKVVFRSRGNIAREAIFFALLVALNIVLLWPLIGALNTMIGIPYAVAMPLGSLMLFGSNFLWQNFVVFNVRNH